MRKIFTILLVFAVAFAFAKSTDRVKSKSGDIQITDAAGGGKTVCQAGFHDEMTIVKKQGSHTLVKASCGQGWVNNADIKTVLPELGNQNINMETVNVSDWIDSPSSVFVLNVDSPGFGEINISRNFNDYLRNTVDREQTEMRNQEN
ncbi:MAG: hypothetical protein LBH25_09360 [Fibromonadaceae bacterium]|jgi:hypothetical protein|nr:hypothetical protein [Fibromonadaceae bacterium]